MDNSTFYTGPYHGIWSVPAAAVFAALYLVLLVNFVVQAFRRHSRVYYSLILFCLVRLTAFILRAVLAGSTRTYTGLLIGEQILFGIGIFALLYSAYLLVLDKDALCRSSLSNNFIPRTIRYRALYRILLLVAIVIGSVGISQVITSNDAGTVSDGNSLYLTSAIVSLILVVLLIYQTSMLFWNEMGDRRTAKGSFGTHSGVYIIFAISILLLIRQAFVTATASDRTRQINEHFWYPLVALPEILAVMLFSIPDLIPRRVDFLPHSEVVLVRSEMPVQPAQPVRSDAPMQLNELPKTNFTHHDFAGPVPDVPVTGSTHVPVTDRRDI